MTIVSAVLVMCLAADPWSGEGWLERHQDEDGRWDADGFAKHDAPTDGAVEGAGHPEFDVGVTAVAVLALGDSTAASGLSAARRGAAWLVTQQDAETGRFGRGDAAAARYQHALATLAVSDAVVLELSTAGSAVEDAVRHVAAIRHPSGAWSATASEPPNSFLTGWMLFALTNARDAGASVDDEWIAAGIKWLGEQTDPETGRVAYGPDGVPDPFGVRETLLPTQLALLVSLLVDRDATGPVGLAQANLIADSLRPVDKDENAHDPLYLLAGSLALLQHGARPWSRWNRSLKAELLEWHRGALRPSGSWHTLGGRVLDESLRLMTASVYIRAARFAGAR